MIELLLYTRRDCELCKEMEEVIKDEMRGFDTNLTRVDIDSERALQDRFGTEVPVLFINGRKAFKYRCTARELRKRLLRELK
jgi:glutaredoxin